MSGPTHRLWFTTPDHRVRPRHAALDSSSSKIADWFDAEPPPMPEMRPPRCIQFLVPGEAAE